ncbi:hypothetical protein B0H10DRAFT_1952529 [Mycena sp. CBHHK59/15]|nr:hypothetical protein B0H10DRAFT_1952529 [Mycena sp. CBHHK59/15]
MSWLSRHRPRRRGAKKSTAPSTSTAHADLVAVPSDDPHKRPPAFRPRRKDTDATLVDDGSDSCSVSEKTGFDADTKIPLARCASPDSFDSPPIKAKALRGSVAPRANPDDPSLWKKYQDVGPQCFGPVPLDCEPPVKVHRSKWSKFASGTTHSISAILQTSVVVGEASNIPYLKGLAGIILLVSNSVQATEDNRVDCIRLSKMVLELASVAARHLEKETDASHLSLGMECLSRACTRILQALQTNSKRAYTRRFVEASNDKGLILDCEKELQHCLDVFQVCSHIATSVALKRKDTADVAFEHKVSDVLLPVKNLFVESASSNNKALEVSDDQTVPVDLPAMPQIFYGRDDELTELVNIFVRNRQAHAVLLGQGGAGKSCLALALLHRPEIMQTFRHRRFLVKCKSAGGPSGLLARLASAMGLSDGTEHTMAPGCKETIIGALESSSVPSLILFDDLDSVWDPPTSRLEVEDLLTELSNICGVSLLLTLRGTQRPLGPAYSKPYPAPLEPIVPAAARQMFFATSDVPEDGADAPLVDVLLHTVGFLPAPIASLAQLAQYEPLPFLIERYREEGTAMLTCGEDSFDASVEASLYSPRVSECPAALEVLAILARFPDGAPKTEVSALIGAGGRLPGALVNKCLSVLYKTSLVVVVPRGQDAKQLQERLKVPEVVRTYLERHFLDGGRFRSNEDLQ